MASAVTSIDLQTKNAFPNPNYGQTPTPPGYVPPQAPAMMPVPQRPVGCPPGLEYLTQIDQLLVHQKIELAEVILGWETNNKYLVKNTLGQQVFYVAEENDCCTRQCCGPMRSFVLHVQDNMGQEVMTLTRPLRCASCCCPCCLQELEVQAPPGNPIGYVIQKWHPFLPKFIVQNEKREDVLRIQGPFCACNCCSDVNFEVMSMDESTQVGRICKQWTGMLQEAFTDADNFGIKFPMDLDVKIKAVLFGALFLIVSKDVESYHTPCARRVMMLFAILHPVNSLFSHLAPNIKHLDKN
uniref:Phospholipid scramblase n=1 Tax=Astyanax mexicanus TaxID=7994 RepID=A0A3B1J7C8_ASTMX